MDPSTYQKYESTTVLPTYLLPKVCEILNVGPWLLITGTADIFAPPLEKANQKMTCLDSCLLVQVARRY